jgi:hypothetical protein
METPVKVKPSESGPGAMGTPVQSSPSTKSPEKGKGGRRRTHRKGMKKTKKHRRH